MGNCNRPINWPFAIEILSERSSMLYWWSFEKMELIRDLWAFLGKVGRPVKSLDDKGDVRGENKDRCIYSKLCWRWIKDDDEKAMAGWDGGCKFRDKT